MTENLVSTFDKDVLYSCKECGLVENREYMNPVLIVELEGESSKNVRGK